jgi:hypothetical protein
LVHQWKRLALRSDSVFVMKRQPGARAQRAFGRLSLDSYRAGPMSATEALGQLLPFARYCFGAVLR